MGALIVLYDIPGNKHPGKAWSTNTLKTRHSLLYKGLPFKTVWVEFPDIAEVVQKIGAKPTTTNADGSPMYTLPAIYDPSTGTGVADSFEIARYLDKQYPTTPTVIPAGTEALLNIFNDWFMSNMLSAFGPLVMISTAEQMNPLSKRWFLKKFEGFHDTENGIPAEMRPGFLAQGKKKFNELAAILDKNGPDATTVVGGAESLADFLIAGFIFQLKLVLPPEEWEQVASWRDGRWAKYLERWPLNQAGHGEEFYRA